MITIGLMPTSPALPRLRRVTPGMWVAVTWCAVTVYTFISFAPFPVRPFTPALIGGVAPMSVHASSGPNEPARLPVLALACLVAFVAAWLFDRRPFTAFALLIVASLTAAAAHRTSWSNAMDFPVENYLAVDVAICFMAAHLPTRASRTAATTAIAAILGWITVKALLAFPFKGSMDVMVALTVAVAWLIGNTMRQTRDYAATLNAQAAEQAITSERLRISRELHDMVAHSVGIIALQSGAASRCMTTQPDEAREAMTAVENASRETLSGLRRMLGALRQSEAAPLEPAPGLDDVDQLAATTTAAGVHVEVLWRGERRPLPPEIDLSAFRIIQESVTNVVRHSGTRFCLVSIDHTEQDLAIEVVDRGRGCPDVSGSGHGFGQGRGHGHGYGLAGMRERVGLLHGEFSAGSRPEGGFRVAVRLPMSVTANGTP
jgi:signal transduction histidine kinase